MSDVRRFKNSWRRAERAGDHLAAFVGEWRAIFPPDDEGPPTVCRYDKDSGWYATSFVLPQAMIERIGRNIMPLELGEYAYQLRSALDGLIWDAITLSQKGTEPPSDANRIEFPILPPPIGRNKRFEDCAFLKFPFPDKLKVWLESIQPYTAHKPEGDPDRGLNTALGDIHDLARFDRHRRLRVVAAVPTSLQFAVNTKDVLSRITAWELMDCDLLGGQHQFLRFQLETVDRTPVPKLTLKTDISFEIILEDIEPFDVPERINVGTQLQMLINAVEYIIMRFEEAFM